MKKIIVLMAFISLIFIERSGAQSAADYLLCQDIGGFKKYGCSCGAGAGILGPVDHFGTDHSDLSCDVTYHSMSSRLAVKVEVTQHSGSESDKWLLHEIEDSYRDRGDSDGRLGLYSGAGVKIRAINGNKFVYWGLGGGSYTWGSNNKVVEIKYVDLQRTKPEPIEIVRAYLQKFPSTITLTDAEAKSQTHNEKWIKDEMERRLWLGDKWFMALQLGKAEQKTVLQNTVDSMQVFLNYREKYYGVKAKDEKNLLSNALSQNDGTTIKIKLAEYKKWWEENKMKAISV